MWASWPPLPPIQTKPLWSTTMPWFDSGHSYALALAAPVADEVAGRVELEHRRRRVAALADARRAGLDDGELGAIEVADDRCRDG